MPALRSLYRDYFKTAIDRMIAGILLVMCAPLLVTIAATIWITHGRPILFVQLRPGWNGQPFRMYKFRTMTSRHDSAGRLLPDDARLTIFGRWLRSTSLDELPELWNVVRGDMSLVGPRPLLMEYLDYYSPRQARRHDVRPGVTGWAQIHGRNDIDWELKFELDVWYVEHYSLWLDVKILALTLGQVIRRRGINMPRHATAEPFTARSAIVLGAGGHAKIVVSTLRAAGWRVAALYDDDESKHGTTVLGVEVRGLISDVPSSGAVNAVIAIGDVKRRCQMAGTSSLNFITVIHPAAWVDPSAKIGVGTVVCAGAVIQPDVRIGAHVIVNTAASIDHDCHIGDFAHVAPGAHLAGSVSVGEQTLVGLGSSVTPGVRIGCNSIVGAGAVVLNDLPDNVVAVGCPARVTRGLTVAIQAA
jgi:sugar O-acyltransferase (sialic acid O-acetyltransferase NeuD family)